MCIRDRIRGQRLNNLKVIVTSPGLCVFHIISVADVHLRSDVGSGRLIGIRDHTQKQPVSYTHLDVYKRQALSAAGPIAAQTVSET